MTDDEQVKPEPLPHKKPEPRIHVPDYVYDEIGPSFTPRIIIRKEEQDLYLDR